MNELINQVIAPEASQLITIAPEKYVAEVFSPFKKALTKAIKDSKGVTYEIATTAGMNTAKELRSTFKALRIDAEKARKDRKAPIIEIGKLLDSRYKLLADEITPHEALHDTAIKQEEERKESEKQRKIAEERARVEAIENRIALIRNIPMQQMDADSVTIMAAIEKWSNTVLISDDYAEYIDDSLNALNASLVELDKMRIRALEREAAADRTRLEQIELARLREENAKRERDASIERKQEEARQAKQREEHAAQMKAMQDKIDQLQKVEAARVTAEAKILADSESAFIVAALNLATKPVDIEESAPAPEVFKSEVEMPSVDKRNLSTTVISARTLTPSNPSTQALIYCIARSFSVTESTALDWLRDADFATYTID
jgi:hypothetical protein